MWGGRRTAPCGRRRRRISTYGQKSRSFQSRGAQSMTRLRTILAYVAAGTLAATSLTVLTASTATAAPFGYNQLTALQKRLVSGNLAAELNGADLAAQSRAKAPSNVRRASTSDACANRFGDNVKVNQNCL